jgi:alanyl-tRNA synthetase
VAWRLYDTYGFPVDLTQLMAEEIGLSVDMAAYEENRQRAVVRLCPLCPPHSKTAITLVIARKCLVSVLQEQSGVGAGRFRDSLDLTVHAIAELKQKKVPLTDDHPKYLYEHLDGCVDGNVKYGGFLSYGGGRTVEPVDGVIV